MSRTLIGGTDDNHEEHLNSCFTAEIWTRDLRNTKQMRYKFDCDCSLGQFNCYDKNGPQQCKLRAVSAAMRSCITGGPYSAVDAYEENGCRGSGRHKLRASRKVWRDRTASAPWQPSVSGRYEENLMATTLGTVVIHYMGESGIVIKPLCPPVFQLTEILCDLMCLPSRKCCGKGTR